MSEAIEKSLKESIALNGTRAEYSGLAVVFGLAIEVVFAIVYRDQRSGVEFWTPLFCDTVLTLGVAGEILFSRKASAAQAKLSLVVEERIAQLNAKTVSAVQEAANANERAAKLEKEALEARLEMHLLKKQMAWRRLTREQYNIIVAELKGKTIKVWTCFVGSDPESTLYRQDIDRALADAGIETKYFSGFSMAVGLVITNIPGEEFTALTAAFTKARINFEVAEPVRDFMSKDLSIIVGTKPPPF